MKNRLAETTSASEGSTEPQIIQARIKREAAKIRELWKSRGWQQQNSHDIGLLNFSRHKSLVLNLAIEEFSQVSKDSSQSIQLDEFCQRYEGIGESLENSIYHQLEVKKYLDENPDLLNLENQFSWPNADETFLNFRVLEELGRGALARVYLCEQLQLGRRSAVVKIELGKSVREPSLLGKLRHPNIVPINWADFDADAGASYLCMPFLGRSTLVDLLNRAFRNSYPTNADVIQDAATLWQKDTDQHLIDISPSNHVNPINSNYIDGIIRLLSQVANSLSYAHSQHVIHGDIKPSNVLLTPEGVPMLFDFNLGRDKKAYDGPAGGTLTYMAPEQLQTLSTGSPAEFPFAEVSTDIYSFGVLCYELLTGKPPFEIPAGLSENKDIATVLVSLQRQGCVNPSQYHPGIDRKLAALVENCLSFEPHVRPASMHAIYKQLVQHSSRLARGRRYASNHPVRVACWSLATLGITAASVATYILSPTLLERAAAAETANDYQQAVSFLDQVLAKEPNLNSVRIDRARNNLKLGAYENAYLDLDQLVQSTDDPIVTAYYGYCLNMLGKHEAAIEWYQLTLQNSTKTPEVLNNLGVSLMLHSDQASLSTRLSEASSLVQQALLESPSSFVIRLNALRIASKQIEVNQNVNVKVAEDNSQWLRDHYPESAIVWESSFFLYNLLADNQLADRSVAFAYLQKAIERRSKITQEQLKEYLPFTKYHQFPGFKSLLQAAMPADENSHSENAALPNRFLMPFAID